MSQEDSCQTEKNGGKPCLNPEDSDAEAATSLTSCKSPGFAASSGQETEERKKRDGSQDSADSSMTFDTWAFAISDSRTIMQPINCPNKDSTSMASAEMRKAEELVSDWIIDKKVVRFNVDKNELAHSQKPELNGAGLSQ